MSQPMNSDQEINLDDLSPNFFAQQPVFVVSGKEMTRSSSESDRVWTYLNEGLMKNGLRLFCSALNLSQRENKKNLVD